MVWHDWECGSGEDWSDWFLESRLFQLFLFGVAWRLACQGMVFSGRWPGRRAQWGELPGCWKPWLWAGRRLGVGRAIGQAICAELLGSSGRAKGWEATGIVEYLPRTICQE